LSSPPQGVRVLCAVDETTGSLAAVRGLRAAGHEPWLALSQPHAYVARSRAAAGVLRVPSAAADPAAFVRAVADGARQIGAAVVLPCNEGSLRALAGAEANFTSSILGAPSRELVDRSTDKRLFGELCAQAGLETPPTVEVSADSFASVDVPAVLKPQRTVATAEGGLRTRQAMYVGSRDELRRELEQHPQETFLLQPFLDGTLGAVCGVVWDGRIVSACHQRSLRIWPPRIGSSSYAETVGRDLELEARVARLLESIGWRGIYGVQFVFADGRTYAIDLNPRVYGSAALAIAAGHNLPAIWTTLLLDGDVEVGDYEVGVRYRYEEDDLRALLTELRGGNVVGALAGLTPRRRTAHAVFSLRDPLPALEVARKGLSALSSRG
jgi:carbamoylphosphate synthase large subunit